MDPSKAELDIEENGIGFNVPTHWVEIAQQGHFGIRMIVYDKIRVLIVDDPEVLRKNIRKLLSRTKDIDGVGKAVNGLNDLSVTYH